MNGPISQLDPTGTDSHRDVGLCFTQPSIAPRPQDQMGGCAYSEVLAAVLAGEFCIDRFTGAILYGEIESTPGGSIVIFVEIMDIDREPYCIDAAYMTLAALEAAIDVGRIVLPGDSM